MKVKLINLKPLCEAANAMAEQRIKGMQKYVFELQKALQKEVEFFDGENRRIIENYGEKDAEGKMIIKDGFVSINSEAGRKALAELYDYETADLPELTHEMVEKIENEYALKPAEYAALLLLVKKTEEKKE